MKKLQSKSITTNKIEAIDLLIIGFVALLIIYTLYLNPWGYDVSHHLFRLADVPFEQGNLITYLSPNANNGKGLPIYIYYSQWIYLIPFAFSKIGFSLFASLKITFCLIMLLSVISFYKFANLHVNSELAKLGTLFYITSNYVLGDIYVRFAYSEFVSYALLPLLLYTLHNALIKKNKYHIFYAIIIASMMILSHPISFMNSSLIIFFILRGNILEHIWKVFGICAIALMMTAFFWLPAMIEKKYVLGIDGLPVNYQDTFIALNKYFDPVILENFGILLLLFFIMSLGLTIYFGIVNRDKRVIYHLVLLEVIFLYFVLTQSVSLYIWEYFKILQSNLFVSRLLFPLTIIVILYVVISLSLIPPKILGKKAVIIICLLLISQGSIYLYHHTKNSFTYKSVKNQSLQQHIFLYSKKENGWGRTEYLPNTAIINKFVKNTDCIITLNKDMYRKELNQFVISNSIKSNDCFFHLPFYWNIRYKAFADNVELPIYINDKGEMLLSPTSKPILVSFTEPSYVKLSKIVSSVTFFLMLFGFIILVIREKWLKSG